MCVFYIGMIQRVVGNPEQKDFVVSGDYDLRPRSQRGIHAYLIIIMEGLMHSMHQDRCASHYVGIWDTVDKTTQRKTKPLNNGREGGSHKSTGIQSILQRGRGIGQMLPGYPFRFIKVCSNELILRKGAIDPRKKQRRTKTILKKISRWWAKDSKLARTRINVFSYIFVL